MTVRQPQRRCPGPGTFIGGANGSNFTAIDDDVHQAVLFGRTRKGRGAVVSDIAVLQITCLLTRVVKDGVDSRFHRWRGVNDKADRIGRFAGVTRGIGDDHHGFMLAFCQWIFWCDFPFTVFTHDRGTYHFIVDDQFYGFTRHSAFAAEYRLGIIGHIAVINWADNRTLIVFNVTNDRFHWRFGVNHQLPGIGWRTFNARWATEYHTHIQRGTVRLFRQGIFPAAISAHGYGANNVAAITYENNVTWTARTVQGWRGVIRHRRIRQVTLITTNVIRYAIERPGRNYGVDGQQEWTCRRWNFTRTAVFPCRNFIGFTRLQRRVDLNGPRTGRWVGSHRTHRFPVNIQRHQRARRCCPHDNRVKVIRAATAGQRVGQRAGIIFRVADGYRITHGVDDKGHWRGGFTTVTRSIFQRHRPAIGSVRQRRRRRPAPVTFCIDGYTNALPVTEVDHSRHARLTLTANGRGVIFADIVIVNFTRELVIVPQ